MKASNHDVEMKQKTVHVIANAVGYYKKKSVSNPMNLLIKILVKRSINQSASNSKIESTQAQAKLHTN
jgi:sulfur relay (sulfurtransferase) DsrC/TusE family protein